MTVRVYRSTDASAPTLTGQTGSLVALLDAVLVNGYGTQTAAGWTIAFTGTSKRNYTMAAGGTGMSLYVDDSGPGAGTFKEARVTGFVTSTALGTGTGQFPTTSQQTAPAGALVVRKSATADATARAWTIVADGHTLYMFAETGDQTAPFMAYPWMFGDFFPYGPSDTSNCILIARTTENTAAGGPATFPGANINTVYDGFSGFPVMNNGGLVNTVPGHYVAASYTGVGGSIAVGKHADMAKMGCMIGSFGYPGPMQMGYLGSFTLSASSNSGATWVNEFDYPNGPDTGLYVSPIWIHHNGMVRGYLKGLWCPLQHMPLGHNDTYTGTGVMAGKSLLAQNVLGIVNWASSAAPVLGPAQCHIETSDTWS